MFREPTCKGKTEYVKEGHSASPIREGPGALSESSPNGSIVASDVSGATGEAGQQFATSPAEAAKQLTTKRAWEF